MLGWVKRILRIPEAQLYASILCVSDLKMSFHFFQALPLLITKLASAVAWQTSTNICWWQTIWTGATAGCYRSFPVNCAALGDERKASAPRTAAGAKLRHRMRCRDFFHRQLEQRREKRPNLKLWNPKGQARRLFYQVKTHGSHLEANRLSLLRRPHKILMKKVPVTRSFTLSVTRMRLQILSTTSGGLGRADEKLSISEVIAWLNVYNCTV